MDQKNHGPAPECLDSAGGRARKHEPQENNTTTPTSLSSIGSERVVLAAMMLRPNFKPALEHTAFASHQHGLIFAAITRLRGSGRTADLVSVTEALLGEKMDVHPAYLAELVDEPLIDPGSHVERLRALERQRQLLHWGEALRAAATEGDQEAIERLTQLIGKAPTKATNQRLGLISASDLDLSMATTEWVIHGIKERDTTAIKYGASGSLKTFSELDELLAVAANRPYHGRKVKGGAAVLIAGEGHKGLARRVIGLAEKRGYDLAKIPFYLTTAPVEFLNPDDVSALRPLLDEIAKKQPIVAISIDTLSRCFGPGDENSTKDMNRFVAEVDALRRDYGAAVTILHHVGHGDAQRERGSYALRGAADWRWLVEHYNGVVKLTCKKAKDHEEPAPIAFKAEQHHLKGQFDDDGRPLTTLVLREVEAKQVETKRRLSATNQQALDALQKIQHGGPVHLEEWREEFYSVSTADTQAAKQKAFARARKELVSLGRIQCRDDHYQMSQTPGQTPDITRTSPAVSGKTPGQTRTPPYKVSGLSGLSDTNQEEFEIDL